MAMMLLPVFQIHKRWEVMGKWGGRCGVASGSNMPSIENPKQFCTSKILRKSPKKIAVNILAYSGSDFSKHSCMFMWHFT